MYVQYVKGSLKRMLKFVFIILAVFGIAMSDDREIDNGGVHCKILGQSGKIMIGRSNNVESDSDRVTVEFDDLEEMDMAGNSLGIAERRFNNFANQEFTFSGISVDTYQNITVRRIDFSSDLSLSPANLKVEIYIFSESGTVDNGGESVDVEEGTVKFNVIISSWPFCGMDSVTCTKGGQNKVGEFLDFKIVIKSKGTNPEKKTNKKFSQSAQEYKVGGSDLVLSEMVQYNDDGNWVSLPAGFPGTVTQGSKTMFNFRFKKFTSEVRYDPSVYLQNTGTGVNLSFIFTICCYILTVYVVIP